MNVEHKKSSMEEATHLKLLIKQKQPISITELVSDFLEAEQKAVTMAILCSLKEQTGKTNSHGIIGQQYDKLSGMASNFIPSTLELVILGITNMKLVNYSTMLETEIISI